METRLNNKVSFSKPVDKSVEAYKTWIMEIAARLTTEKNKIEFTESEWRLHWRDYWNEKPGRR